MPAHRVARRPVRSVREEEPVDLSAYDEPDDGIDEPRSSRRSSIRRSRAPEPDEEPRSRGRRHHQADEDEDIVERPSRGRTRPRPVDEEDGDADEEPRGRRGRSEPPVKVDTSGGFARFRQERAKSGGFPDSFKPEEKETYLVYFLENEPFSVYGQHWLDEIKDGRRSFVCLGADNGCPLCDDLGDTPRAMALFNLVVWEEVKKGRSINLVPAFKVWECGPQIATILGGLADELGEAGLSSVYVTVRKTSNGASGRKKRVTWTIHPIKERDVEEDWEVDPLTDEDLDAFDAEMKDDSFVKPDSRSDLRQVVKEVQRLQD